LYFIKIKHTNNITRKINTILYSNKLHSKMQYNYIRR